MAKAIFSVDKNKIHTNTQFNMKYNHNFRVKGCENANPEKEHLNKELIPLPEGCNTYVQAFNRRKNQLTHYKDHPVHKNAVKAIEVMCAYGSDTRRPNGKTLPKDFDQQKWEEENVKWLKETFGEENVISAVLHMDETLPHIHAIVIPVMNDRLNARDFMNKEVLEKCQESYGEKMEELGLEKRVKYSRAKHEDIRAFYTAINDAVIERLPEPEPAEDVDEYFERAQAAFTKRNLQNLNVLKKMEAAIMDEKNANVQQNIDNVQAITELENMKSLMGENVEEMKKKIRTLEYINLALKEYPDKEYVKEAKETIYNLIQFGKEWESEHSKEECEAHFSSMQ